MKKRVNMRKQIEREGDRLAYRLVSGLHFPNYWKDVDSIFDETHIDIKESTLWFSPKPPLMIMEASSSIFEPREARKEARRVAAFRIQPKELLSR
jgi:hypothetical protein